MAGRLTWLQTPVAVIAGFVCLAAASMALSIETRSPLAAAPSSSWCCRPSAYLALTVDPAVTLTLGVVLTPFAGNWQQLGIPGVLAPDRLLIAATIVLVVVQAATGRGEPLPRLRPVHFVLALAVLWAVGSALISHTLFQRAPLLKIVEAYGVFPFLIFYLAPVIYTHPAQAAVAAHGTGRPRRLPRAHRPLRDGRPARAGVAEVHPQPDLRHPQRTGPRPLRRRRRQRLRVCTCVRSRHASPQARWRGRSPNRGPPRRGAVLHRHAAHPRALGVDGRRCGDSSHSDSRSRGCGASRSRSSSAARCRVLLALVLIPGLSAKVSVARL